MNTALLAQTSTTGCDDGCMQWPSLLPKYPSKLPLTLDIKSLAAITFTAFVALNAHAQAGADCLPGGTTAQTNACAIKAFQEADTDNQILYGDVMRAQSAHERPALRRNQNEWTRQRVQQCKKSQTAFEAQPDWPRRYHECLVQQIKARNTVIKQWLHQGLPDE